MSTAPAPDPAPAPADPETDRLEGQLAQLRELAGIGLGLARELLRRAETPVDPNGPSPPPYGPAIPASFGEDASLAFARISRAVRLTVALQARLVEGRKAAAEARAKRRRERADARKEDVRERVAARIETQVPQRERDAFRRDLGERLEDEDLAEALPDRPVREIVAMICDGLGIDPGPFTVPNEEETPDAAGPEAPEQNGPDPDDPHQGDPDPDEPDPDATSPKRIAEILSTVLRAAASG